MEIIGESWIKWPARVILVMIAIATILLVGQLAVDVFSGKDPISNIEKGI